MSFSQTAALFGVMFVLSITPGPSDFAVVVRSMTAGFRQGVLMTLGIVAGDFLFIAFAIYSLREVAESMNRFFLLIEYGCAAYLIWLGMGAFKSSLRQKSLSTLEHSVAKRSSNVSSFFSGLLITLGDPGAILFYMGLLPAFVNLRTISVAQTLTVMGMAALIIGSVKITEAYLADRVKGFFKNARIQRNLNMAAGCVLIGTGVILVIR